MHMKCHTNINSTPPTQLPHKFSYIVAIFKHNHFESPNITIPLVVAVNILIVSRVLMKSWAE
jgi:hypothetical protein